jgi:hypothetical protein
MTEGVATNHDKENRVNTATDDLNLEPSFSQWAYFQRDRDDLVGRVARWIFDDFTVKKRRGSTPEQHIVCWPHRARTADHMINHLRTVHAASGKGARENVPLESEFRDVFDVYKAAKANGTAAVPKRRGGLPTRPSEARNIHRGYLIPPTTAKQIKDLSGRYKVSQGEVLERIVAGAHRRAFR